jgi:hypothetical protein
MVSIRQYVSEALPDGGTVSWVSASQEDLDFLIINSNFTSSSSIQSLLRKGAPILLVKRFPTHDDIEQNVMPLPFSESAPLKAWLQDYVLGKKRTATTQMILQESDLSRISMENARNFKVLLSRDNGFIYLSDNRGAIGVVDTARETIGLVPERRTAVDMEGQIKYEKVSEHSHFPQSMDLMHWLWDVLWSNPSSALLVSMDQPVKLHIWPQPSRASDRKDILRMSAWLAQGAATATTLAANLQLPEHRVQHFLSALVATGYGEAVIAAQAHVPKPVEQAVSTPSGQSGIRRLLSGLRSRLGL